VKFGTVALKRTSLQILVIVGTVAFQRTPLQSLLEIGAVAVQKTPLPNLVKIDTEPIIFHLMEHWRMQGDRESGATAWQPPHPKSKFKNPVSSDTMKSKVLGYLSFRLN